MSKAKTICFALMDPPFEASRTTTALRAIDAALRLGVNVNVFAYEGAVMLPFRHQQPHSNPVHGRDTQEEDHPLPREWVAGLIRTIPFRANGSRALFGPPASAASISNG